MIKLDTLTKLSALSLVDGIAGSNLTLGYSPNLFKARGMPEACD